jgi:thiamine kinase-like enzyme
MTPQDRIMALPIWTGPVTVQPLGGGITNVNFIVQDARKKAVVRIGHDIPLHQILRSNELSASRAAQAAGVSPAILHHEPGILVIDFIDGKTLTAADIQQDAMLEQALLLVRRAHQTIPHHLRGPAQMFWPFHVIRDYAATLTESKSPHVPLLPNLLEQANALESAVGRIDLIFGHNDLLPANFIHDGNRLWLIDWDYAGFNSPLFDLGGLAANNNLSNDQEAFVLERYFGTITPDLPRRYRAMKSAAALRETLWSMVSELHSELDFDFAKYTKTNLATYQTAYENL